jgi:hypothetical protein
MIHPDHEEIPVPHSQRNSRCPYLILLGCYGFTYWVSIVLARNPIAKGALLLFQTPISVLGSHTLTFQKKIWIRK